MSVEGRWSLVVRTPIGTQRATLEIGSRDGVLHGVALGDGGPVDMTDVVLDGDRLTWRQSITEPMRLRLVFDMTVTGDGMSGTSKAGRLPAARATAHRIPPQRHV
ncbi:hypothetical protein ACFYYH_03180 [Streptomyces sp. NPDC002018]|uniref:hypothetical protein n=1 Tax=Streptomyces sp. NPDC002018 TaxID=3364629 RepID=UPI0036B3C1A1